MAEGKKGNNFKHGKKWLVALTVVLFAINSLKFRDIGIFLE